VADLEGVSDRRAYFYCAMVFMRHAQDPTPLLATAAWHGEIIATPAGDNGFGYDPHFFIPELGKTSAQLPAASKNSLSHRGKATAQMIAQLRTDLPPPA